MCLSAVGALQHGGQACSAPRYSTLLHAVQPIPVVPFMVQGPLISTGSCTYFMDTSLHQRGGRGGREVVVSHRRRLMMDCTSSYCASQAVHFTTEGSGSFGRSEAGMV